MHLYRSGRGAIVAWRQAGVNETAGTVKRRTPWRLQVFRPSRAQWRDDVPTGSASTPVGLATETDTAFALAAVQRTPVGLAVETDSALALAARQVGVVGLATETDTAFALSPSVPGGIGIAVETDTAFALAGKQVVPVGMAVETDSAFARPSVQIGSVQMALEIDAAFALPAVQRAPVGMAVESDYALALSAGGTGGVAGAADVWNYVLSNGLTAEQNVVSILALLSELHLIHGLTLGSPLSVSATARSAGPVSQTVAESGSVVTVTRQ